MYTGPHIKRDGLIFGYDTGRNPSSNFDHRNKKRRFFKGKPVTNRVNYGDDFSSWATARNSGSYPTIDSKVAKGPFKGTKADRLSLPSDGSYPRIYQNFTPTTTATHTFSIWLKGETDGQGCFIGCFRNGPWSGRSYFTTTITTEWKHYSFNVNPADLTAHQMYIGSHNSHGGKVFLMYGAQLEVGTVASPFNISSRSSTNSLIDLAKTSNIDVSNMSFDSDGLPTFDGTDDRINGTWPSNLNVDDNTTPRSWEVVFNSSNTGGRRGIFGHKISSGCSYYCNGGIIIWEGNIAFNWYDNSTYRFLGSTTVSSNKYYHVVATFDTDRKPRVYVNGILTNTYGSATNLDYSGGMGIYDIGWNSKDGGQHYFTGTIPVVKFYKNKALSPQEIKQNFRAYKNRFNI